MKVSIATVYSQLLLQHSCLLALIGTLGDHTECMAALESFGIPRYAIPVTSDGGIAREFHLDWIAKRQAWEAVHAIAELADKSRPEEDPVSIVVPTKRDVLMGRGKRSQNHPGNTRLHMVIEDNLPTYECLGKHHKRKLVADIVHMIQQGGGRFLKLENGTWVPVDDATAIEKVSHDFRTMRKRLLARAATSNGGGDDQGESSTTKRQQEPNDAGGAPSTNKRSVIT